MNTNETTEVKNQGGEKERNRVVLLILGIATVLVALIGATFAYFTAMVNNVNGNQSITVSTTTVTGLTYTASDSLALIDATPGDYATTTFTITNPNTATDVTYSLKFVVDVNDFVNDEGDNQLVVTISGGQIVGTVTLDYTDSTTATDEYIVKDVTISANGEDEYTARIDFFDTNDVQDTNQGKNFAGHIEVTEVMTVATGN